MLRFPILQLPTVQHPPILHVVGFNLFVHVHKWDIAN